MRGAGGSEGGLGRFFIGFTMFVSGGYLFLAKLKVGSGFGMGMGLYSFGGFQMTTGMVLVPLVFGIAMLFYNAKNPVGWLLTWGSLAALVFGVITNLRFHMHAMSAFELLTILVLLFGGLGLLLSSLRDMTSDEMSPPGTPPPNIPPPNIPPPR